MNENGLKFDPRKDSIKSIISSHDNNNTTMDFNYPSLNRKDLMDISQINTKSSQFKKLYTNRDWSMNLYNLDIEGSCPRRFSYFTNKEDFINKNNDIEKSSPKSIYSSFTNKVSFNLTNDDIELSKPQCNKNMSTRHTNPLSPKYILSKPHLYPPEVPRFIRDSLNIKDIKGSCPNKLGFDKKLFKFPIKKEKIKESSPKQPYIRKTKYEFMNYQDVTKTKIIHRNTNPLRPQYKWSYIEDKKLLGPIDGNIPIVYSKYMYRNPFNLNTKDIEGANTGSTYPILRYKGNTFYLNTKDIEGAQGDTLIRGIITKRNINPITPVYQYLGHSEIQNMDNNPYFIDFNKSKSENKKNIKKIKDPNDDDKIKNKTINEYRALNRKLLTNKFYGHLCKNISDKTLEFKTDLKNKFFDLTDINNKIKKFNKLKEQLRPLNKRKMKIEKNYSTFN